MKISESELAARKNRIVHRAFELFCQKGIDRVTIEEIAKAAEVSVISVYRYFNTKAELLLITQRKLWKEVIQSVSEYIVEADSYDKQTGFEQIRDLINGFEDLYQKHREYLLFAAYYKLYLAREHLRLTGKEYADMLSPIKDMFIAALRRGMEDGSLTIKGDPDDIFYCIWGILRGYVEEMTVYDRMLDGKNEWTERFPYMRTMILNELNSNGRERIFPPCG